MNKTVNDRKNSNNEIFMEYFGYQNTSFLAKHLHKVNQDKNEQMVNQVNDTFD